VANQGSMGNLDYQVYLETKGHQGSMANQDLMANQGYQGHLKTKAHQGFVAHKDSVTNQGFVRNKDLVANQDSMANQGHKVHQGSMANQGSMGNEDFVGNQGHQDHLETKGHQGSIAHQDLVANQGFVGNQGSQDHLETKDHQDLVANQGFVANQSHLETKAHKDFMAHRGSVANQGYQDHQDLVANQDSMGNHGYQDHLETKDHRGSVANHGPEDHPTPRVTAHPVAALDVMAPQGSKDCLGTEVCQGFTTHLETEVHQSPRACLDLKDHEGSGDNQGSGVNQGFGVNQVSMANLETNIAQAPGAHWVTPVPMDLKLHEALVTPRVPTFPVSPVVTRPTVSHPCPHVLSGAHLAMALLTLTSLLVPPCRGSALEFGGAPGQWARYERWAPTVGGQLSFNVKTNISRALLLYLDDGGNCDFLELLVADGRLRLRFAIACAEPAVVEAAPAVSDGRWHAVLLTRNARQTALAVDGD
ncbi:NRX2A protein, partial [Aegotheles bennettii]|nr:NRX2A protein [Aegotheles bennettii]